MDYTRELNNFLQRPRRAGGDLTPHLSWILDQKGPDNQKTHYATARFRDQVIGSGRGTTIGVAKSVAANQALQYLNSLPPRHPLLSP